MFTLWFIGSSMLSWYNFWYLRSHEIPRTFGRKPKIIWTLTVAPQELVCLKFPKRSKGNLEGEQMSSLLAHHHYHNSLCRKNASSNLSCFSHTHSHTHTPLYFTHLQGWCSVCIFHGVLVLPQGVGKVTESETKINPFDSLLILSLMKNSPLP